MSANAPPNPRSRLLIPYLVLALSLIVTLIGATYVALAAEAKDRAHFENAIERTQVAIQRRLETYVNLLRGAAGLFAAEDDKVTLKEFQAYIERLNLAERYPGIQGIGVSGMASGQDVAGLTAALRKQGIPNFELRPPGPRQQYHAIVYLEPQDDRNRQAIGYDMFTEPTRRAAMELARDTGNAATSGKVSLVQEIDSNKQAGFLIYFPIYFTHTTPATIEQRRITLGGFIFSPFRTDDLLAGIFGNERFPSGISFSVYDGDHIAPEALLHRSDKISALPNPKPKFAKTASLEIPGHHWTLAYASGPQFEASSSLGFALLVLAAGGVVSMLLFSLTAAQASAQRRAEQAAQDLRHGEQELLIAKESAERALAQAEQASELKDQFLATVSHELRTPLNAILGWSQLLGRGRDNNPDELQHGLETIERSARTQSQLIEDLLDVSRIVAGKLRLDVRAVQLGPVIEAAIASVRLAADAKTVHLQLALDPTAGPVNGDPTRLQQIVWNLLSNAVKFTPSGGHVHITLKRSSADGSPAALPRDRDSVELSITDTGIGIPKNFLPHVFERFRQADATTTRRYGGLGLGLGIVRHLTELHGGTVHADSLGPNQGSTFTVSIPLAIAHPHIRPSPHPTSSNQPALQGIKVLLVEDDRDARELITRILTNQGASVTAHASVADAMRTFHDNLPDIIISDIGMPDEDGYTLIARIRALAPAAGANLPAIALTALARAEDRDRALAAGFHAHLAKPFEPADLTATIVNLIAKR